MPSLWPTLARVPRELPDAARSSKTIATARSRSSAGCCFRDAMSPNFPRGHSLQETRGGPFMWVVCLLSWSGWPDLNRRPLRPELAAPLGVCPVPQLMEGAGGSSRSLLSGDVAVLCCCTSALRVSFVGATRCAVLIRRPSDFHAGHDPSRHKMYVRLVLSPVAAVCRWLLLLLSAQPRSSGGKLTRTAGPPGPRTGSGAAELRITSPFYACSQAEVGGVVAEEYAEPSRAVFADSATGDDAVQRDRLAVTTLQTEQARAIAASISTRQVTYLQSLHPDRHRVRVVGIVLLGNQHGTDRVAYPVIRPARTHQAPQILLVVRLADYFQIVTAVEEGSLAIPHPGGSFVPAGCYRSSLLVRVSLRRRRGFHGRLRSMAGLLVPGPSPECVHCRVFDLEFCQADRAGSALQLPDRLWRDGSRSGAHGMGRFPDSAARLLQGFRREQPPEQSHAVIPSPRTRCASWTRD